MTGLVYKEWKQNRWYILAMILLGAIPTLVALRAYNAIQDSEQSDGVLRVFGMLVCFFAAGILQTLVLRGDDRKLWGYFISTTADGYKGFIRIKYEMIFVMIVLLYTSVGLFGGLYSAVLADMNVTEVSEISGICAALSFLQIFLRAVDIPFILRFGNKRGSMIKMIFILVLVITLSILVLTNIGNITVTLFDFGETLLNGDKGSIIFSALPVLAIVVYYLSYRISCRLYLKGVEQYDK